MSNNKQLLRTKQSRLKQYIKHYLCIVSYPQLVYSTQVNSTCTFCMGWLASSQVISQVLFTSEQPKKNKMAFVGTFSQIKLLFGPPVIQLVWYILKQLFTSVSVKVVDIDLAARWIIVNYSNQCVFLVTINNRRFETYLAA